jgi:tetratricopeptide (TPR) repeat protein
LLGTRHLAVLPLLFLCFSGFLYAQRPSNLRVYVTYEDDRPPHEQLKLELLSGSSGTQMMEAYTDARGTAELANVPVGTYQISVTGQTIQPRVSDFFDVDPRRSTQTVFIRVKPAGENENQVGGGGPAVSVHDLNIPESASKQFDQATEAMNHQDWQKAIAHLNEAIAIYPKYVEAYTNLGAAYEHSNDSVHERDALTKAIALDGNFAPALMNLGMLSIVEKKYLEAEDELSRASAADSTNPQILMLLAQAELLNKHFDQAIASTGKLHSLPHHEKYAKAHYIAARAFEHENRATDAANQLQEFLDEQPTGPMADAVRKELVNLRGEAAASPAPLPH